MKKFKTLTSSELSTINGGSINPFTVGLPFPIVFTNWFKKKIK